MVEREHEITRCGDVLEHAGVEEPRGGEGAREEDDGEGGAGTGTVLWNCVLAAGELEGGEGTVGKAVGAVLFVLGSGCGGGHVWDGGVLVAIFDRVEAGDHD